MRPALRSGLRSANGGARSGFRDTDGWLFAYEITRTHFSLKLFRLVPVAWIRLEHVRHIRQRSSDGLFGLITGLAAHPFRSWYWPHSWMSLSPVASEPYVIRTASGRQIYVRLRTGFHYRLRTAVGDARAPDAEEPR